MKKTLTALTLLLTATAYTQDCVPNNIITLAKENISRLYTEVADSTYLMDFNNEVIDAQRQGGKRTVTLHADGSLSFRNSMTPGAWYTVRNTDNSCESTGSYDLQLMKPLDAQQKFSENVMSIYLDIPK